MDVVVCVKHVPETSEAELKIDATGKNIEKTGLVYDINEWDDYALEEAVRIKEKQGGTVTAITIGTEDSDSTLRKCLARGADKAIRLTDPKFEASDGYPIAKILHSGIKIFNTLEVFDNLPWQRELVLGGEFCKLSLPPFSKDILHSCDCQEQNRKEQK